MRVWAAERLDEVVQVAAALGRQDECDRKPGPRERTAYVLLPGGVNERGVNERGVNERGVNERGVDKSADVGRQRAWRRRTRTAAGVGLRARVRPARAYNVLISRVLAFVSAHVEIVDEDEATPPIGTRRPARGTGGWGD